MRWNMSNYRLSSSSSIWLISRSSTGRMFRYSSPRKSDWLGLQPYQSSINHDQPAYLFRWGYPCSCSFTTSTGSDDSHKMFLEQLSQLEEERQALFGSIDDVTAHLNNATYSSRTGQPLSNEENEPFYREQIEQLKEEREHLFGFTEDEQEAWSNAETRQSMNHSLFREIKEARANLSLNQSKYSVDQASNPPPDTSEGFFSDFTHLSPDQKSVQMVDVGSKVVTQRRAVAQSKVIFPTDVANKLLSDWRNPKGPIFETAILAGIMAAKKTSDLIPLCHPLPLDKVSVNIEMVDSFTALIRCECRVTHRTGVEMEALTGASVAALTIYDMVKALSHDVCIAETKLIHKSGGRRTVDKDMTGVKE